MLRQAGPANPLTLLPRHCSAMEPSSSSVPPPETLNQFFEGINLILSRWTALQMAVEGEWGGRDSRQKASDLASHLLSWFSQSKDPLYIDDLEYILLEEMVASFNTEVDDGSEQEIAEDLMVMHEECLQGNYRSVEKLRKSIPVTNAVRQSKQAITDDADESSDEEVSDMMVDESVMPKETVVRHPTPKEIPDDEGWSVVAPKRNRGRKSG